MMEKKSELVAWTKNITDMENARLYVVPEVELDLIEPLISEVTECRKEQEKAGGHISLELAQRFVRVYEQSARLDILMGNIDYAIRSLLLAAEYCILEGDQGRSDCDTDLESRGTLREQFVEFCQEAISLAGKYGFKHVLKEKRSTLNRLYSLENKH